MVERQRTRLTYFYERWRAVTAGILETAGSTFLLLIAVRWFEAGAIAKALVASGGSLGLLLTPGVVFAVSKLGWNASHAAAVLSFLGAICFGLMALAPFSPIFVLGSTVSMAAASAAVPLMTQIYQENYPERERGRLFSRTVMIRIGSAALFSQVAGLFFQTGLEQFRWLLLFFGVTFLFSGYFLSRCPSRRLAVVEGMNPFRSWNCLREDRLFRNTLIAWMLMGFANLMMFPLRVEYLANPKYGLALSVGLIAVFTGVLPNLARLVLSPVWGWLFDHMNFFVLRIILNLGFALGILTFFLSRDMTGLIVGAVVFGISSAGGDVAWSLWVTKFAPPGKVADYMAVHTFFTGIRGMLAPMAAFYLLTVISMSTLGWISAGLIVIASLLLLTEVPWTGRASPSLVVAEKIPE